MKLKNNTRLWMTSLLIAWIFDLIFFRQEYGIWFALFVFLCLAGGFFLAAKEKLYPVRAALVLLIPLGFFTVMTVFRLEPFTTITNILLSLGLAALLVLTFRGGRWLSYSLADFCWGLVRLAGSVIGRPLMMTGRSSAEPITQNGENETPDRFSLLLPVLRGLLLALPVVALLAALLASADPIFSNYLKGLLAFVNIDRLPEYIFRLAYILALGYVLAGLYIHALTVSHDEKLLGEENPWLRPFLGRVETTVILVAVNLLLGSFIFVQFKYFFGGQANIAMDGFTYADYTRRGFSELVAVAFLSLLLFISLSTVTRFGEEKQRRLFSVLGSVLVALVMVVLVSAFQRLLLYEGAYGFSRIRSVIHVFMIWLGFLLASTALIEMLKRPWLFGLLVLVSMMGFGITLNFLNVDDFIVRQNVQRAENGSTLDMQYLVSLSNDAVPAMVEFYTDESISDNVRQALGAALACRLAETQKSASLHAEADIQPFYTFPGFHVSRVRASHLLAQQEEALRTFPVFLVDDVVWQVKVKGEMLNCHFYAGMD